MSTRVWAVFGDAATEAAAWKQLADAGLVSGPATVREIRGRFHDRPDVTASSAPLYALVGFGVFAVLGVALGLGLGLAGVSDLTPAMGAVLFGLLGASMGTLCSLLGGSGAWGASFGRFSGRLTPGRILLTLDSPNPNHARQALDILEAAGAIETIKKEAA